MPFSGEVTKKRMFKRSSSGEFSFTGSIGTGLNLKRSISGVLSFTGDLTSLYAKRVLNGILSFRGLVTRVKNGVPVGTPFVRKFLSIGSKGISFANGFFRIGGKR